MALRKANILVVDDKRANLLAMDSVLGQEHNVVYAESGEEAIALLHTRRDVDLILMDVQMPGLDGFERLRRSSRWRPTGIFRSSS
jgi:CheY-like chemotaxis protein